MTTKGFMRYSSQGRKYRTINYTNMRTVNADYNEITSMCNRVNYIKGVFGRSFCVKFCFFHEKT